MGPDLGPGSKSGGPRARAPSFPLGYFLERRARILTRPTFKKKLSLQASRPFPEGAPRKVSIFVFFFGWEIFGYVRFVPRNHCFLAKMARFRLRVFQDSDIPRAQGSCMPRTVSCMPRHQLLGFQYALVAVEGCLRRVYFLKTGP